jgi:acetyl-CoA carboxylase carboxyltransferase component
MGLEGAVRLGYRKELAAIENDAERQAAFDAMVAQSYAQGKALNVASVVELDSVIDPRDTRDWIVRAIRAVPAPPPRTGKKRPSIDTW